MTAAYATRSPLQLVTTNTHHYTMSADLPRRSTRRSSARLLDKEDTYAPENHRATTKSGGGSSAGTKHSKTATNGTGSGVSVSGKGKRKHEYDEEDDGFTFTRTRSKRTKAASSVKVPEPVAEEPQPDPTKSLPTRRSRKKSTEPSSTVRDHKDEEAPRRRSARNSGDKDAIVSPKLVVSKRRTKDDPTSGRPRAHKEPKQDSARDVDDQAENRTRSVQTPVMERETSGDVTKIALPFADTPIIRRNKEMRKGGGDGSRRSSLGMRGRRASSLIDSGTSNALPHAEVESSEFYKHIESGLPEPRRMRQLLTWCGTRALGDKPSFATEDSHAKLAAREIKLQLLNDFSAKSEMSDWFSREDAESQPQALKPNPKNVANLARIAELEQRIARLQSERQTWDSLLKPPPASSLPVPPPLTTLPTPSTLPITSLQATNDPSDLSALSALLPTFSLPAPQTSLSTSQKAPPQQQNLQLNIRTRLHALTSPALEFEADKLADSVHILSQHLRASERVGRGVLGACAKFLEERERVGVQRLLLQRKGEGEGEGGEGKKGENGEGKNSMVISTRDALRALSRVVER